MLGWRSSMVPVVIWDVQRMGLVAPPTRTSQGDILFAGHGDTKHPLLFPGSPTECFPVRLEGLDIAEPLQTPVFVLSDLDIGMNLWMTDRLEYPTGRWDAEGADRRLPRTGGTSPATVMLDGDGIGYCSLRARRTRRSCGLPCGTGHNEKAVYSERAGQRLD